MLDRRCRAFFFFARRLCHNGACTPANLPVGLLFLMVPVSLRRTKSWKMSGAPPRLTRKDSCKDWFS